MAKHKTGKAAGDVPETDPKLKADKPKRSGHALRAPTSGLAAYAVCGSYTLVSKQTSNKELVGCRECRRALGI